MISVIFAFQLATIITWGAPLGLFAASAWRSIWRRARGGDDLRAAAWFSALACGLFPFRWIVYHDAIPPLTLDQFGSWVAVYVLGILAALRLTTVVWARARLDD